MAELVRVIWVSREAEYFCARDWTGQIKLKLQGKIDLDPIRAVNDGCALLRAKVGRHSVDLGQRQRSVGAHAMFSRT